MAKADEQVQPQEDEKHRNEQWFNNYSWGQHHEKVEVHVHGQE